MVLYFTCVIIIFFFNKVNLLLVKISLLIFDYLFIFVGFTIKFIFKLIRSFLNLSVHHFWILHLFYFQMYLYIFFPDLWSLLLSLSDLFLNLSSDMFLITFSLIFDHLFINIRIFTDLLSQCSFSDESRCYYCNNR